MVKRERKNAGAKATLTSKTALDKKKAEVARQNRVRGAAMEKRIEMKVKGIRTRGSGSGSTKGDVIAPYKTVVGRYLIECKTTSKLVNNKPAIDIHLEWLTKMQKEARLMQCSLYMLVFHYYRCAGDFCLIPLSMLEEFSSNLLSGIYNTHPLPQYKALSRLLSDLNSATYLDFTGIKARYFNLRRDLIYKQLLSGDVIKVGVKGESYVLMSLKTWLGFNI